MSRRIFRIRREEAEPEIRIVHRWLVAKPEPPKAKLSDQELLFRLLDLRLRGEANGEAYLELLREYIERVSRAEIDVVNRLGEYIKKLELLGDGETLREIRMLVKDNEPQRQEPRLLGPLGLMLCLVQGYERDGRGQARRGRVKVLAGPATIMTQQRRQQL